MSSKTSLGKKSSEKAFLSVVDESKNMMPKFDYELLEKNHISQSIQAKSSLKYKFGIAVSLILVSVTTWAIWEGNMDIEKLKKGEQSLLRRSLKDEDLETISNYVSIVQSTPTKFPSKFPSKSPTNSPSRSPTIQPSKPTTGSAKPTKSPTSRPSIRPTRSPSRPSIRPTRSPSRPSIRPTRSPTKRPRNKKNILVSITPTEAPTASPTDSLRLTGIPTISPSHSLSPTDNPTETPTVSPSESLTPTNYPLCQQEETPCKTADTTIFCLSDETMSRDHGGTGQGVQCSTFEAGDVINCLQYLAWSIGDTADC